MAGAGGTRDVLVEGGGARGGNRVSGGAVIVCLVAHLDRWVSKDAVVMGPALRGIEGFSARMLVRELLIRASSGWTRLQIFRAINKYIY